MATVRKMTELTVTCEDKSGALCDVLQVLGNAGVNLLGYCGYGMEGKGSIMLVPEDAAKALAALQETYTEIESAEVVLVETSDKVGAGAELAKKIADAKVYIHYSYATAAHSPRFAAVFRTDDDDRVVSLLAG